MARVIWIACCINHKKLSPYRVHLFRPRATSPVAQPLFRFLERKPYSHVELAVFYESALEIVRFLASILIFYYGRVNVTSVEGCS